MTLGSYIFLGALNFAENVKFVIKQISEKAICQLLFYGKGNVDGTPFFHWMLDIADIQRGSGDFKGAVQTLMSALHQLEEASGSVIAQVIS